MRTVIERAIEQLAADLPQWSDVEPCSGGYILDDRILWTRDVGLSARIAVERLGYHHGSITYGDPLERIAWFLRISPEALAAHAGLDYEPGQFEHDAREEEDAA